MRRRSRPPTPTESDSRRARTARRRRRSRAVAGVAATFVVAAAVVLVVTDTVRIGASGPHLARGAVASRVLGGASPDDVSALSKVDHPRPLTHDRPLRLWIGGDSLAGWLGPSLGTLAGDTGVVKATVDYKVSSGIASNDIRDWPREVAEQMPLVDPEVAVFMVGANDTPIVGNDGWQADYRAKVDKMMDLLVGAHHRTVLWVGSPPLRDSRLAPGAVAVDRVMRQEAAKRADVVYVDAYSLFAGPDGGYTDRITIDGKSVRVRNTDGIHFTPAGADYLAQAVFRLIDARWHVTRQAATDQPITYTTTPGSGCGGVCSSGSQPSTSRRSSSGNGYGSGTGSSTAATTAAPVVATTTPTTAAPVTAPPTTATTTAPAAPSTTAAPPPPPTTVASSPSTTAAP